MKRTSAVLLSIFTLAAVMGASATTFYSLPSTANIYSAGLGATVAPGGGGGGTLPLQVSVSSGDGSFQFQASGTISQFFGNYLFGPDGWNGTASDINAYGGISGFKSELSLPLVGVFLGPGTPVGPAPSALDFTGTGIGRDFLTLSPSLGQVFYIGDGLGAGNAVQTFNTPLGATRLYLGFADAADFLGDPGHYDDNTGSLSVGVTAVPEPATAGLIALGLVGAATRRRNRAR
jgi:hypothetical protein